MEMNIGLARDTCQRQARQTYLVAVRNNELVFTESKNPPRLALTPPLKLDSDDVDLSEF